MIQPTAYGMYALTMLLCIAPLVHILARGKLRTYFVYFVFGTGHLCLNVVASISPNIVRSVFTPRFQAILLVSAVFYAGVYILLMGLAAGASRVTGLALEVPRPTGELVLRRYVKISFGTACAAALFFYVFLARPVIFRFDLYGQWSALINERWEVVFRIPSFNWFSLAFFEIPTMSLILCGVMVEMYTRAGNAASAAWWRRMYWVVLPIGAFFAVGFLHIVVAVYLLAGAGLIAVFYRGRIPMGLMARFGLPALLVIVLLYFVKKGFRFTGEFAAEIGGTISHRIFEVNSWAAATTVYLFPDQLPYLGGASMINFSGRPGVEQVDLASILYPYIYNDVRGGAPAPAVFESYANFGWSGVLVTLLIISGIAVFATLLSWSGNAFNFSMSVYLALKTLLMWQAPLWFGIMDPSLLILLIVAFGGYRVLRLIHPSGARWAGPPREAW